MKYKWILFDADDTLFDFTRSALHAFSKTLEHFKIPFESGYHEIYQMINLEVWSAYEKKEITALELRRIRFERFLDAIKEYRDPLEMNAHYLSELSRTDFLIAGARTLVAELLEKDHRLCLITNGLKEVQRPRVEKARITHFFEAIVVSDEIGVSKPHAGFFEHAFNLIGNPAKEAVLVVGDSLSSDIQGGNNYGVDTCWFNPAKAENLTPHQPTFEISRLEEIKSLIHS